MMHLSSGCEDTCKQLHEAQKALYVTLEIKMPSPAMQFCHCFCCHPQYHHLVTGSAFPSSSQLLHDLASACWNEPAAVCGYILQQTASASPEGWKVGRQYVSWCSSLPSAAACASALAHPTWLLSSYLPTQT